MVSEVASIREQIAAEYMAAKLGLHGLSYGTSRHQFITARQERIGILHEELHRLVGDEAIVIVAETLNTLPETVTQYDVLNVLRHELGQSEETEHLLDWIQEMWETTNMLIDRFGVELARKIILAPLSTSVRETLPS
jgi:short-subunit dehydrogenase involved in D-alanine esterification of teichoic acids